MSSEYSDRNSWQSLIDDLLCIGLTDKIWGPGLLHYPYESSGALQAGDVDVLASLAARTTSAMFQRTFPHKSPYAAQAADLVIGLANAILATNHAIASDHQRFADCAMKSLAALDSAWPIGVTFLAADELPGNPFVADDLPNRFDAPIAELVRHLGSRKVRLVSWLILRRLFAFLTEHGQNRHSSLPEDDGTMGSVLLKVSTHGHVAPLFIVNTRSRFFGCYPDPATLGVTVLDRDMLSSLDIAWSLAEKGLRQRSDTETGGTPLVRLSLRLPQGIAVPMVEGASAGALFACGMYAAAHGITIDPCVSASVRFDSAPPNRLLPVSDDSIEPKLHAAHLHGIRRVVLCGNSDGGPSQAERFAALGHQLRLEVVSARTLHEVFAAFLPPDEPKRLTRIDPPTTPAEGGSRQLRRSRDDERKCEIASDDLDVTGKPAKHLRVGNLPKIANSFIGRETHLRQLASVFTAAEECSQLVTICGPPGTGKTRLSIELGQELLSGFPGGCWFIDLSEAKTAADISHAVAKAFGIPLTGKGAPVDEVANFLAFRDSLLLILDNFEQVVEHSSTTIQVWRRNAPHVSCLVTSRAILGLSDEHEYHLQPLAVPTSENIKTESRSTISEFEGVRLFLDRARQVRTTFMLDGSNFRAVAEICRQLDGTPLAIELAAVRTRILDPHRLLARLNNKLQFLKSERRDVSQRHQTLMAAIEWSFDLLEIWEKSTLFQASIFRGGFFLEAAETIIDVSNQLGAPPTVDVLQGLVEKSLLHVEDTDFGPRFRMLLSIQEYANQNWCETADPMQQQMLHRRFMDYFLAYSTDWNERLHSEAVIKVLDRLQLDIDNVLASHSFAISSGNAQVAGRIITAIDEVLASRGLIHDRIPRLRESLRLAGNEPTLSANLAVLLAEAVFDVSDWDMALDLADKGVLAAERSGSNRIFGRALCIKSHLCSCRGEYNMAIEGLRRAESYLERGQTSHYICLMRLGWAYAHSRDFNLAFDSYKMAETEALESGDLLVLARIRNNCGVMYIDQHKLDEALESFKAAETLYVTLRDRRSVAGPLSNQGMVHEKRGEYGLAISCFDRAELINREFGNKYWLAANLHNRAMCWRRLGEISSAVEGYRRAETLNLELGNRPWLAKNLNDRGLALMDVEKHESALVCFSEAESINREIGGREHIAYNLGNRGRVLGRLKHWDAAFVALAEAELLNRECNNSEELAENLGNRGRMLFDLGRLLEAREHLRESLKLYQQSRRRTLYQFEFRAILAMVERCLGDFDAASSLAREALEVARELKLTESHPAIWFTRLLPATWSIVDNRSADAAAHDIESPSDQFAT